MATSSTIGRQHTTDPGDGMLHRRSGRGSMRGFGNLFANENRGWWRTRAWLVQLAVWMSVINGLIALVTYGEMPGARAEFPAFLEELMQVFFKAGGAAVAVGAVIAAQGALVGEKQLGTAAWIMSKPVGRSTFLLAKLGAYMLVLTTLAMVVPSMVFYGQTGLALGMVPALLPFITACAVMLLHLGFYLALTLLLGAFTTSRGPVAGGAMGFMFAGLVLPNFVPQLALITPWSLAELAAGVALGTPLPTIWPIPILATVLWTVIFIVAALWRFGREEF